MATDGLADILDADPLLRPAAAKAVAAEPAGHAALAPSIALSAG